MPLDQEEKFKLAVHLGLFGFGVACALYNLGAWCSGRQQNNRNNACVYSTLVAYETHQVFNHLQQVIRSRV